MFFILNFAFSIPINSNTFVVMFKMYCPILFLLISFSFCTKNKAYKEAIIDTATEEVMTDSDNLDIYFYNDSVRKMNVVAEIIQCIKDSLLDTEFENYIEDREHEVTSEKLHKYFNYGNIFSKNHKHLFIHLSTMYQEDFYIYFQKDKEFTQLLKYDIGGGYIKYFIIDRNGDGLQDLDVEWYSMAGCCLRNSHLVFLCKPDGTFTDGYQFINPTFNTQTKTIRGVSYGHPGFTPLYKYKWKAYNAVDTIEYIYPNIRDSTNITFIKTNKEVYINDLFDDMHNIKYQKINKLPGEYLDTLNLARESLEWFGSF